MNRPMFSVPNSLKSKHPRISITFFLKKSIECQNVPRIWKVKKNRIEKNSNGENIIRGSNQTVEKLNWLSYEEMWNLISCSIWMRHGKWIVTG